MTSTTDGLAESLSGLKIKMTPEEAMRVTEDVHRLPKDVRPLNYDIFIEPNWTAPEFSAVLQLDIEVLKETDRITLNAVNLKFTKLEYEDSLEGARGSAAYVPTHKFDEEQEVVVISFRKHLPRGQGKLTIAYYGHIESEWRGFYRYAEETVSAAADKYRFTLATHMEPCHARRVFPCWDDPSIKATFAISLVVPVPLTALSNMPKVSSKRGPPGKYIVKFEKSRVMSTYLVAFVIGDFESKTIELPKLDLICNLYTGVGKSGNSEFARDVVAKLLPFYTEFFGFRFPLPKLDIVTISEFASGAMENWGLIIFNEGKLLTDFKDTSSRTKQTIAQSIAHELAHQWFGNLVTFDWWDDMWLKEGMALFLEYHVLDQEFPEYNTWAQFATHTMIKALELDGLEGSHPIALPVPHPSKIVDTFDRLAYIKGGALIRMLHNYLSDRTFRKGMSLYIHRHKWKTARAADLWAAFEEVSKKPIKAMMQTWTTQKGFPLIKIDYDDPRENNRKLTITQQKYCAHPKYSDKKDKKSFDSYRWIIPLTFASEHRPKETCFEKIMDGRDSRIMSLTIPNVKKNDWIKINAALQGFYRVHYPHDMLQDFIPSIKAGLMHPLDRLGLIDDLFSMVKTGDVSTVEMLKFLRAYMKEDNFNVWFAIDNIVGSINILLSFTELHTKFQNYAKREILKDIEEKIGWDRKPGEDHEVGLLRVQLLSRMVNLGSEKIYRMAKERFKERDKVPIPPDIRSVVYRAILRSGSGSSDALQQLLHMYRISRVREEKQRILRALGSVSTSVLMRKVLDFAMSDEISPEDVLSVILGMCHSKLGMDHAWNFFKEHREDFQIRFPMGQYFIRFIKCLTWNFASEEMARDVEDFFAQNEFDGLGLTISQVTENIRINEEWIRRDEAFLRAYLTKV